MVKADKADGLMKLASDTGRVQTKAGTQAALDAVKRAYNDAGFWAIDVSRVEGRLKNFPPEHVTNMGR